MGQYASTFALVGGAFAVVDCFAETMRGAPLAQGLCIALPLHTLASMPSPQTPGHLLAQRSIGACRQ